jgi:hypothetical protein
MNRHPPPYRKIPRRTLAENAKSGLFEAAPGIFDCAGAISRTAVTCPGGRQTPSEDVREGRVSPGGSVKRQLDAGLTQGQPAIAKLRLTLPPVGSAASHIPSLEADRHAPAGQVLLHLPNAELAKMRDGSNQYRVGMALINGLVQVFERAGPAGRDDR